MAYFELSMSRLKSMREHAEAIRAAGVPPGGQSQPGQAGPAGAQPQKLDPHAVAEALAEALKTKNSTTEAIAVRSSNISDQLGGKRAY
jgi:hypothetical protein